MKLATILLAEVVLAVLVPIVVAELILQPLALQLHLLPQDGRCTLATLELPDTAQSLTIMDAVAAVAQVEHLRNPHLLMVATVVSVYKLAL
jgi:hypothetical protein